MFMAMYSTVEAEEAEEAAQQKEEKEMEKKTPKNTVNMHVDTENGFSQKFDSSGKHNNLFYHNKSAEEIRMLAMVFAKNVPPESFTPAEVQGYLLKYKTDPQMAVDEVEKWVKEMRDKLRVTSS
jgi:hypothetical protein